MAQGVQKLAALGVRVATKSATTATSLAFKARPHLQTFWGHARRELGPPGISHWPEVKAGYRKLWTSLTTGQFLNTGMRAATKNTLVAVEIGCWFIVGEMIGRRSIIGYKT